MAISTPVDIVLDVVRAADPAAAETARARLASFAGRAADTGFEVGAAPADQPARASSATPSAVPEAFRKFEAMVLQTFVQSMLPQETESVYGEGVAGQMWQALLAEKLGEAMASRGGIGIADRILRDYYLDGEETVPLQGVSHDPDKPERDTQRLLSVALVQEIQRRAAQTLNGDQAAATSITSS